MATDFHTVVATLQSSLKQPLPGANAHGHMAPRPARLWPADSDPAEARLAAGLLLIFPRHDRAHIVLTVRADTLGRHRGQVSLPGGAVDPGETIEHAALREAHEEIGLDRHGVELLGPLSPIDIAVSRFRLHPIVASIDHEPSLAPASGEVARIVTPSIDQLLHRDAFTTRVVRRNDIDVAVPTFLSDDTEIWGATAMILAEFFHILGWSGP